MKRTKKVTLNLWLTAALFASSVIWAYGQSASAQNKNVKCTKGFCTVNGAFHQEGKSDQAKGLPEEAAEICNVYTFTGKGSWLTASNWENSAIPPATLQEGDHVIIDGSGPCMYNGMTFFNATEGSFLEIKPGKQLYVSNGNTFRFNGGILNNNGTLSILSGTFEAPKEANDNENSGKITTTKLSQVKSSQQDAAHPASSEKVEWLQQNSKTGQFFKAEPAILKPTTTIK